MSNSVYCDLNSKRDMLKVTAICPNVKCICQKQNSFIPRQFQIEGIGYKDTRKRLLKGSQIAWDNFLKPAVNTLAPVIGTAVGAKSKINRLFKLLYIFQRVYQDVKFEASQTCMGMS